MKSTILNIRMTERLKEDALFLSEIEGVSISEYGRIAIHEKIERSISIADFGQGQESKNVDLVQSLAFAEFIFWIYDKKRNPEVSEILEYHVQHLGVINKMQNHPLFTEEILKELDKVAKEVEKVVSGEIDECSNFTFSVAGNANSFNYVMFSDFMYAIRYDKYNKKVIFID